MPTYRSISLVLHSQFDIQSLPEYYPLPQEHYTFHGIARTVPKYVDDVSSTCSVYIPVLPGSTFWIGYSVSAPVPKGYYFLFKLYINGAHVLNWSTGKEEGWKGKTMFGLYNRPGDQADKAGVEKRVLCFTLPNDEGRALNKAKDQFDEKMCMEIRVHRAHGRKRVEREIELYDNIQRASATKGVNLVNAGRANSEQPKRFYKFALTDPVDQPFATFKYFYCTWEQLQGLDVLKHQQQGAAPGDDMSVIEPYADSISSKEKTRNGSRASCEDMGHIFHGCGDSIVDTEGYLNHSSMDGNQTGSTSPTKRAAEQSQIPVETRKPSIVKASQRDASTLKQPRAHVPYGEPSTEEESSKEDTDRQTPQRQNVLGTPSLYGPLMRPSIRADPRPQKSRRLLTVPQECSSAVEEWRVQMPSPIEWVHDGITKPPMEKRKGHGIGASSLMSAISSTWRRIGTSSSENQGGVGSRSDIDSEV